MHNSAVYVFFLLLSSYMFQHGCHLQGAYTKIYGDNAKKFRN